MHRGRTVVRRYRPMRLARALLALLEPDTLTAFGLALERLPACCLPCEFAASPTRDNAFGSGPRAGLSAQLTSKRTRDNGRLSQVTDLRPNRYRYVTLRVRDPPQGPSHGHTATMHVTTCANAPCTVPSIAAVFANTRSPRARHPFFGYPNITMIQLEYLFEKVPGKPPGARGVFPVPGTRNLGGVCRVSGSGVFLPGGFLRILRGVLSFPVKPGQRL